MNAKPPLKVNVSPDKMKAYLTLPRSLDGGGYPHTADDVYDALGHVSVEGGVLLDRIDEIIAGQHYVNREVIAEGQPAVHGTDAQIELLVELPETGKPQEKESGRVDYRDLGLVINVSAGQPLARKIPPTEGTPGFNVLGRPLPAHNGRDVPLPTGHGTQLSETDPLLVVATINGQLHIRKYGKTLRLSVEQTFTVNGDVDFSTGNLNVDGQVIIHGNVRSGFEVKATGDITVHGFLEDATLESDSDVYVKKGVVSGPNRANIVAQGDVYLQFADRTNVAAGGNIYVEREAVRCHFQAEDSIIVGSEGTQRGDIVAGTMVAGNHINVVNVGSRRGAVTRLRVGEKPSLARKRRESQKRLETATKNLQQVNAQIATLEGMKDAFGQLPPDRADLLSRLEGVQAILNEEAQGLRAQLEAMAREKEEGKPHVIVYGHLAAWTEIIIKDQMRMFTGAEEHVQIDLTDDGGSVVATSLP